MASLKELLEQREQLNSQIEVAAAVDFFVLTVNITLVFDLDFHLLNHVFRQPALAECQTD